MAKYSKILEKRNEDIIYLRFLLHSAGLKDFLARPPKPHIFKNSGIYDVMLSTSGILNAKAKYVAARLNEGLKNA